MSEAPLATANLTVVTDAQAPGTSTIAGTPNAEQSNLSVLSEAQQSSTTSTGKKRKRDKGRAKAVLDAKEFTLTPWLSLVRMTEYDNREQRLHDEIVAFAEYVKPTTEEQATRREVVARVSKCIKARYRDATITVFGSVAQDLAFPDGDIDLVAHTRWADAPEEKRRGLFQLKTRLLNAGFVEPDIFVVAHARIPLIQFRTIPELGSYKVDVSMNSDDGVRAISIIKGYVESMLALRPLVIILKALLGQRGLNSPATSGLGSYALICMVISFLQLNPANFDSAQMQSPQEHGLLGALLIAFLDYYTNAFPYATAVIDVRSSCLREKEELGWADSNAPTKLSVRCLIHPENDVGKPTNKIEAIRTAWQEALNKLKSPDIDENNILGAIIGLSQKTVEHRANVQHIFETGALYRDITPIQSRTPTNAHWSTGRISQEGQNPNQKHYTDRRSPDHPSSLASRLSSIPSAFPSNPTRRTLSLQDRLGSRAEEEASDRPRKRRRRSP